MEDLIGRSIPILFMGVCCFIIIVPFTVLLIFLIKKSKDASWSGVIIKKVYNQTTDMDDNTQDNYYFEVQMDNGGRNRNIGVNKGMYDSAKEGDKIKKDKGKLIPEIIK
ncbi:MAG TPA: hypothetical protein PK957_03160 [Candidatus Dojkabacteria bacterium]|nr:hypothetical protein [Candidatus Dojkabacteria bacterium]HQF37252.1 hypothetical protein [Candidatus Dojkabacteria bacterium]